MLRSHKKIIADAGGPSGLRRALSTAGIQVAAPTAQSWAARNSIPAEYWSHIASMGLAALDELARAVAAPSSHPQHEPATGIGGEVSRTATVGGIGQ